VSALAQSTARCCGAPSSLASMPLSNYAKDKYVAPQMSKFTAASIRDMSATSAEQEHWLMNFVLNTLLRVNIEERVQQTLFNFLHRTESAFREYSLARDRTLAYLSNTDAVSDYIAAIAHWEVFLSHSYQAYCLLARKQQVLFKKGDGSVLERLNLLYNRSKHADGAIEAGQLPEDATMGIWLTNDGLRSTDSWLTFDEMAEALEEIARWSDAAQDPLTMREKLMLKIAEAAEDDEVSYRTVEIRQNAERLPQNEAVHPHDEAEALHLTDSRALAADVSTGTE
jgi:hypothetical protein